MNSWCTSASAAKCKLVYKANDDDDDYEDDNGDDYDDDDDEDDCDGDKAGSAMWKRQFITSHAPTPPHLPALL